MQGDRKLYGKFVIIDDEGNWKFVTEYLQYLHL